MRGPANLVKPTSGKRLRQKTWEEDLLFPVMSDPSLRVEELLADEKANNWMITFPLLATGKVFQRVNQTECRLVKRIMKECRTSCNQHTKGTVGGN